MQFIITDKHNEATVEEDVNENEQDACSAKFNALLNSLGESDFPLLTPILIVESGFRSAGKTGIELTVDYKARVYRLLSSAQRSFSK